MTDPAAPAHCGRAHEHSEANTYRSPTGRKECRECRRYRWRKWWRRRHGSPAASWQVRTEPEELASANA